MKALIMAITVLFLSCPTLWADSPSEKIKKFSKKDIRKLAPQYVNNNVKVKNPAIVDVDGDGNFDLLSFTSKGNIEYYRNTGTLEEPFFVLENRNFDNREVNSILPKMLVPIFFADNDGDSDPDMFAIINNGYDSKTFSPKYSTLLIENTMAFDHYTLITIILVLVIVVLVIAIV